MSRYVDVEPLDVVGTKGISKDYADGMAYVLDLLDNLPVADVKPVRHGQWIYGENEEGHDGYKCSECGKFIPWEYDKYDIDFIKEVHYCSNCGAKMDGEEDDFDYWEESGAADAYADHQR